MDFDFEAFVKRIVKIKSKKVSVGYGNYNNRFPEPPLEKTWALIQALEIAGIEVERKTLRKKWDVGK